MECAATDEPGQQVAVVADADDHAVLTVLRAGVPIGVLECRADGTMTCGVFDGEGAWLV